MQYILALMLEYFLLYKAVLPKKINRSFKSTTIMCIDLGKKHTTEHFC